MESWNLSESRTESEIFMGIPRFQNLVQIFLKWHAPRGDMNGYLGSDKNFEGVKEIFYWPGYHLDVSEWILHA